MTTLQKKLAPQSFTLQGEFLGFFEPGNRAKYLQLATPKGAVFLSVSPQAQKTLPLELGYNQMIQVLVHSQLKTKTGQTNLKVVQINSLSSF